MSDEKLDTTDEALPTSYSSSTPALQLTAKQLLLQVVALVVVRKQLPEFA